MILQVDTRPGLHGEREPCAFMLGGRRVETLQIVDRWLAERHSYFKIASSDGDIYILRRDSPLDRWELTLFEAAARRSTARSCRAPNLMAVKTFPD